jgi:hypothetical protein
MLKRTMGAMATILVMSSPAIADEFYAVTPSGATEMVFAEPPSELVGRLSSRCIDTGWSVTSSSNSELVCEAPLNFGQSLLGTMLMGNSYSTPPRRFFKYTVSTVNGLSRVQASGWMELQMAFGQIKRTDFAGPEFHNGAMTFMGNAGGHFPKGTRFPNHAYLGAQLEAVADGKFVDLRVAAIEPGSAAQQAGVQVGDKITSLALKRFKNADDLLDATAKATKVPSYPVEIVRDGKIMKLTVPRSYRPTYDVEVAAKAVAPVPVAITNQAPPSVADELSKLAKLLADGLITQGEFDQQKAKLLAR